MMTMLQDLLHSIGLTHMSTEIEHISLPSIRLRANRIDEPQLRLGTTKFGGSPDAPQGFIWPEYNAAPLAFIAQINLSDATPYDTKHLLPASGILYFFFDVDAFFNIGPRIKSWSVLYDRSTLSVLQRIATPEAIAEKRRYLASTITLSTEITLPDYSQYDTTSIERLGMAKALTPREEEMYYQVQVQLAHKVGTQRHTPLHRLLGHADPVQWDMHNQLPERDANWQLLLQVDSDGIPNTDWGDTGRIYYWIRTSDLLQCNFNRVQLLLQCT